MPAVVVDGPEGTLRLEFVVNRVYETLTEARLGSVVAVWSDGGVSAHRDLAFRFRRLPDGSREEPVVTFVRNGSMPTVREIRDRILHASGLNEIDRR